jgi:raffinose/stachyose/melibiose transport system substrate-binding protein
MNRFFLLALALFGLAGFVQAQSPGLSTTAEKVKLSVMLQWSPEDQTPDATVKYDIIKQYQAEHPELAIEINSIPHDDFVTKIKALIAANDLPDLWSPRGDMILPAKLNDLIKPVDEYLAMIPGWKDMFLDGAFDDFKADGKIWAIPAQMRGNSFMFANIDVLKECGVAEVPQTLDALKDAIKKIKAHGYIPIGLGNKGKYVIGDTLMSAICDRYTGSAWFQKMTEKKGAAFTDPDFVKSLAALYDLGKMGAFNADLNSIDESMGQALFYNRKSAMFFSGGWSTYLVAEGAPKDIIANTRMALPPSVVGGKGKPNAVSAGAGWGYQISKSLSGNKLKHAVNLMYRLSNYDYARLSLDKGFVSYPSKTPANANLAKVDPITKQYLGLMGKASPAADYFVLLEPAVLEVFGNVCQELAIGVIKPEDAAKQLQSAYEQYALNK